MIIDNRSTGRSRGNAKGSGPAIDAGVSAYVVDGLRKERVKPILDLAIRRFNAFAKMQTQLDEARSALADCRSIDQSLRRAEGQGTSRRCDRCIDARARRAPIVGHRWRNTVAGRGGGLCLNMGGGAVVTCVSILEAAR